MKMDKKLSFIKVITILVFGLLFLIPRSLYSEDAGCKYLKNYSFIEYDHQPQNWGIAQDQKGLIYLANNGGVLIFDGTSWRLIYVPNYTVRSLAVDMNGTVYIGGINEIGYLAPDLKGSLQYVSLLDHIDDDHKNFSNVYRTHAAKQGIYFCTSNSLFHWYSGKIKVWKKKSFRASFIIAGDFYVQQEGVGLMQDVNGSLQLIPAGETFAKERIWMMVPFDTDKNSRIFLIGTRSKGFYLYNGITAEPFSTGPEVDDYLKKNLLYTGIRLSCGDFALGTLHGGLVIMDSQGGLKYIFDKTSGLQDENVRYVFEDFQGNLWLALNKGISKIEYRSPFLHYDDRSALPGMVLSVIRHHRDLYVGTSEGLFVLRSQQKIFHSIQGIRSSCWNLLSLEHALLAATSDGLFQVGTKIDGAQKILKEKSFALLPSGVYPGVIWCGTSKGLTPLVRKKGQWEKGQRLNTIAQDIRCIAEDKNGHLWLVTSAGSVLKGDFQTDINHPLVNRFEKPQDSPGGVFYYAARAAGHVIFATDRGLYRFDEEKQAFMPDLTLGEPFAGSEAANPVFRIVEDKNGNIWFHSASRNYQAIPGSGGSYRIYAKPFRRIPFFQVNTIYPDPDGKNVWFGSIEGLIRYDKRVKKNYQHEFNPLVRRVLANGKLLFDGCKNKTGKASKDLFPVIEYKDRNLHFEFAAPSFEAETETQYQCFLAGYDDDWSSWSKDSKRDYTNLNAGLYTFRVQARNVYEDLSNEAVFKFKVLSPWYKTWWAYLVYGIGFLSLMFLVVKWRSSRLEYEKQKLEHTIKERTREINEKNDQLEKQTLQLLGQSEKLKEMDKVKSRFFANISHEFRTPLTLIMSPLEQMLSGTQSKKQKEKLRVMVRNSQRLLTLINQLLDLSRFDSGKMKLQAACQNIVPFLKGTLASFHMLARQNKLDLEFQSEEEEIFLYFHAQKMEEVMYNLLINAVKFTPPEGKISVSVFVDQPGFVNISVRDTGIGISKEQLDHIFDRFYQAENFKEKSRQGSGIGLALTKEIVILHHGKIDVHSQEEKGTEFVIQLPLGREHLKTDEIQAPSEAAFHSKRTKEIETLYITEEEADQKAGKQDGPENKTEAQGKNVILVVEDHADVRKYIRDPLQPLYTVVEAGDGKEGIARAKEIIPDLIVSDIMMPEVDGYELCQVLKKDINTSHIPIILLTAKASEESVIQGLETGADDYITKPFNSKILLTRIKNLIDLRRQLQLKIQRQKMLLPAEIQVSSLDDQFLKRFQGIIEENLDDPEFTIDQLCEKLDMGRSTLFKKIKALTGEPPNQFILSYRLERGSQLLKDKSRSVTEVALEVGFSTPAYFAKCFKERFHQSPSSFQASEAKASS